MKSFVFGATMAALIALVALFAPLLAPHDPAALLDSGSRVPPGGDYLLGTDQIGRDLLSRVIFGARTSFVVGVASAALAGMFGVVVGVLAGWRRGWLDSVLMRMSEVFLVLPAILVAATLVITLGRSTLSIIFVLAVVGWPIVARVVRAEVIRLSKAGFVDAARVSGSSELRIVRRHVLPHLLPVVAALTTAAVATSILAEASLSFLGIGITEPTASWGQMIAQGRRFIAPSPHLLLAPSFAVFTTVLAFVLMGNGLRTVLRLDDR